MTNPNADPRPNPEQPVTVGRILAPHGIRGEVKVESHTDFPERFEAGSRLWIRGVERTVERGRWQGRSVILKLHGADTRADAEALRNAEITVASATKLTDDDVYYVHDLIGLRVEDGGGELLGSLAEILTTGATDVYIVHGQRGELLLPALDDVIRNIDLQARRILVDVPEGIEFQARTPPQRPRPRRRPTA